MHFGCPTGVSSSLQEEGKIACECVGKCVGVSPVGLHFLHRVFGCLISCLRWGDVLLLPLSLGNFQKEPSALSLPTC